MDTGFVQDEARGDIICTSCGLVLVERIIDMQSEWRNFDGDVDKSRAEKVNEITDDLYTTLGNVPPGEKGKSSRISKIHKGIANDSSVRNLNQAVQNIDQIASRLDLKDNIKDRAKILYKDFISKKKGVRGSNSLGMICAVLYIACKEAGFARTFRELARDTDVKEKDIRKMFRIVSKILPKNKKLATGVAGADLVYRFCNKLGLEGNVVQIGCEIARKASPKLEGKSPSSIAAASIYMACKEANQMRSEKEIASAASISASTIHNLYNVMQQWASELLPA